MPRDLRRRSPARRSLICAGAPGAAVATGDADSQAQADTLLTQYADSLTYDLPPPGVSSAAAIDAAAPAVLDAWHATVRRELISASGRAVHRHLLVRLTVDYVPSNTGDFGKRPTPARVVRCFAVSPNRHDVDGPGGVDPDWRAREADCPDGQRSG